VSAAFFGGWIVGADVPLPAADAGRLAVGVLATQAIWHHELMALGALGLAILLTGRGENRTGAWTVLLFYSAHQIAKINLFLGVPNPGTNFLPDGLVHFAAFYGPRAIQPFLVVSIIAFTGLAVATWSTARAAVQPYLRTSSLLLCVLAALAALEYVVLGLPVDLPIWDVFFRVRGDLP
jgi:putative photosynthetic complex assembly protein 2